MLQVHYLALTSHYCLTLAATSQISAEYHPDRTFVWLAKRNHVTLFNIGLFISGFQEFKLHIWPWRATDWCGSTEYTASLQKWGSYHTRMQQVFHRACQSCQCQRRLSYSWCFSTTLQFNGRQLWPSISFERNMMYIIGQMPWKLQSVSDIVSKCHKLWSTNG